MKKQNEFSKVLGSNKMGNVEGKQHRVLWKNPSVHCKYVFLALVNKEADWPIARHAKVRQ